MVLKRALNLHLFVFMKTIYTFIILLLSFNLSQAAKVEESLRIVMEISSQGKVIQVAPFCSGSLVRHEGQIYLATAKHCFGKNGILMGMIGYDYYQKFDYTKRSKMLGNKNEKMTPGTLNYSIQQRRGSKLSTKFSVTQIGVSEDMAEEKSLAIEHSGRVLVNDHDGLMFQINITEQELLLGGFKIFDLAAKSFEPGSVVTISGYPAGKFRKMTCDVVSKEKFLEKIKASSCVNLESIAAAEINGDIAKFPDIISCEGIKKHPGGISGGPVYKGSELAGVASSAPSDSKALENAIEYNPLLRLSYGEDDIKAAAECYTDYNEFLFVSPVNSKNMKETEKGIFEIRD